MKDFSFPLVESARCLFEKGPEVKEIAMKLFKEAKDKLEV